MQKRISMAFAMILGWIGITDNAATQPRLHREVLDSSAQLIYIKDGNELYLIDGQGNKPEKLLETEATITPPTWSPQGKHIAFLSFGKKIGPVKVNWRMPFSDQKAKLVVYDPESKTSQELGEFSLQVRHSGPEEKELTINPPDWSSDGEYLYITDNKGIHRMTFSGEQSLLVEREGLRNVVWAPHGSQVAYTEGKKLFLNNAEGKQEINVTAQSSSFATLADNDVRKLAYSPDGFKLAVGARNRLIVLDLSTNEAIMIHKSRDPIYWISWLPAGDRLVFLTGLPKHGDRAGDEGYYNLFQISARGTDRVELYKDRYLDVRDACPSLSSDGHYLAMIAKPVRGYDQVFVIATNGSGSVQLTSKGSCASPSWRPRTVQ